MRAKNRKTGDFVQGTFGRREGKAVLILENGKIVDARDYKLIETSGGGSSKEEQFAMREWLRNNPDCVYRRDDEIGEDEDDEY